MTRFACLAAALLIASALALPVHAASGGVIVLYHHVSDTTPAATSVTPQVFERHLDYLEEHDFAVWDLERLLDAIHGGEDLPANVIAITFDDAYESVYTKAWPRLRARGWPFTVFVNTDAIDAGQSPYMSWDQLRELADAGVAIENHSASHGHLARTRRDEPERAWKQRVAEDLARAAARIETEIGRAPSLLAWPYGEDAAELRPVAARGHRYSLAQRSGAAGPHHPLHSIPRFPLATGYDDIERLALAVHSRPLPVGDESAHPPLRRGAIDDPKQLELALIDDDGYRAEQINCFAATGKPLDVRPGGERLQIDLPEGRPGRNKINCTAPATDGSGDYYWYSFQWLQRRADGTWPPE
ncbi:MAG: polysaccharide deacetylase family protein [Halioglobus sp.]|nr:polysaccharide deacetylase family protein [Halioglobus sp.]